MLATSFRILKATAVMKKPSSKAMKKEAKKDDWDIVINLKHKNGNTGQSVTIEEVPVRALQTPEDILEEHLKSDFYNWEDDDEMDVAILTAKDCTTFKINNKVVDGKKQLKQLNVKAGDFLVMKTKKFEILAGAVMDVMEEPPPPAKLEPDAKHSMPPPTGTFLK